MIKLEKNGINSEIDVGNEGMMVSQGSTKNG